MTKKILAVSLALCVMFTASSAMAHPRRPMHPMPPHEYYYDYGHAPMHHPAPFNRQHIRDFGERDYHARFTPDMPKEIRAMAVEAAKLRIDLDEALHARPMDKAKAFEIHDRIMKLEQDIERWKFVQRVDRIEAFRKHREERRNRVSAAETPKPEQPGK